MKVRLGYVAIANEIEEKVTSSSVVTLKTYQNINGEKKRREKLKQVTLSNLQGLEKIIKYNIENQIHFYRLTSKLIPLVTHPEVDFDEYKKIFIKDFQHIGKLINESNMRIDAHPDQFNVINSTNSQVFNNTIINLQHQLDIFKLLNYENPKLVIHTGGAAGGKESGIERFIKNFKTMPEEIQKVIILENDDKIFNVKDVLKICKSLNIPMVLDIHHHNCNNDGESIEDYLEEIFNTWNGEVLPPKMHFSTPRDNPQDRKHADYISASDFYDFVKKVKFIDKDFDVMLECKKKDTALYKLIEDLKENYKQLKWIDNSTFEF